MVEAVAERLLCVGLPQWAIHRLQEEVPERQMSIVVRRRASLQIDQLEFVPGGLASAAPALGLTQIQSIPVGAAIVPLVSTATSNLRACSASISARSSCSSGSPPVQTTNFFPPEGPACHVSSIRAANSSAESNLPHRDPPPRQTLYRRICTQLRLDPPRVPTTGCIPRTGRRRPPGPSAHPRLAMCRRSL